MLSEAPGVKQPIQLRSSNPSLKKSAPPLLLETHGSRSHAVIAFSLHLMALCAVLGATAHTLHFLFSEIYLGQYLQQPASTALFVEASVSPGIAYENPALAAVPAISMILIALITSLALIIAILASALNANTLAQQRLSILWQPNGNLQVRLQTHAGIKPQPHHKDELQCRLEPGCYSSHWLVILHLSYSLESSYADSGHTDTPPQRERFCILLARDSLSNQAFRHLRLWMRLVAPQQL